jgi:hypothetical protein
LQLKLDRRFSSVTMEANYTWSKALTNASGSQTSGDAANRNPITDNPFDPRALDIEKSLQYIDVPHIFNVVMAWDLPFGKSQRWGHSSVVDRLAGGWTIAYAGQFANGALMLLNAPYTILNGDSITEERRSTLPGRTDSNWNRPAGPRSPRRY